MAETASILCPNKTVLLPEITSGCPMAEMVTPDHVRALRRQHPGVPVVAYINTTAAVKAEIDVCCTSANAVQVVNAISSDRVIFVPDRNLGSYVASRTKKEIILGNGYCPTHEKITAADIAAAKQLHPNAEVVAHPECRPDVVALADKVFSTSGMCEYAKESSAKEMIVSTEVGILYRLRRDNPEKSFYPANERALCPNMKKNTLEKVLWALEDMKYEVRVTDEVREKSRLAIEKMLEYSR
jgi:quinolinate synthase